MYCDIMGQKTDSMDKYEAYNQTSLREMIRADVRCWGRASLALTKLGFYAAFFYRISYSLSLHGFGFLAQCVQFISNVITGSEISNNAIIGPGLKILHSVGVQIGPEVKIGDHACICECSAIIRNIGEGIPIIGDYLWMSSGAKIMGSVVVGDFVRIGPNSVLFKDIDSNMIAMGNPARIMPKSFRNKV